MTWGDCRACARLTCAASAGIVSACGIDDSEASGDVVSGAGGQPTAFRGLGEAPAKDTAMDSGLSFEFGCAGLGSSLGAGEGRTFAGVLYA